MGARRVAAMFVVVTLLGSEARAAPSAKTCADAAEHGQMLRRQGMLLAARDEFLLCSSNESCPSVVRSDCATWASELLAATPTIVIDVRDETGHDVFVAKIYLDDKLVAEKVEGRAIAVDPGYHTVRVEPAQGPTTSTTLIAKENVKARVVEIRLGVTNAEPPPAKTSEPRGWPWHRTVGIAAIVVGVAGIAYGVGNYVSYDNKRSKAESQYRQLSDDGAAQAAKKLGIPKDRVDQQTMCNSTPPAAQQTTCDQRAAALQDYNQNETDGTKHLPLWIAAGIGGALFVATGVVFLVGGRALFDNTSAVRLSPTVGGAVLEGTF